MMIKKVFIVIAITCFSLVTLYCAENPADTGKSFLWRIEAEGSQGYLLGSIHLLKKDVYPLKDVIEEAFEDSEVLAVEADVSPAKMQQGGMGLMLKGMYTGEETLQANISPKTFDMAKKKLEKLGMSIDGFLKFKPWMVAMTIPGLELMKQGFDPKFGIDMYFLEKAAKRGKEIAELEGLEFQVNLFDGFSKEESEKFLISSIMEADELGNQVAAMVAAWQKGDAAKMNELMTLNIRKEPSLKNVYKKMIEDRNVRMAEKIDGYLKSGKKYFIVVGAAHIVGEEGIVNLLKKKGVSVQQL